MEEKNNEMSKEFVDIEDNGKKAYIPIVIVLYVLVIILTILLVFGLKTQKDKIIDNADSNNSKIQSDIKK